MKKILTKLSLCGFVISFTLLSFITPQESDQWKVPENVTKIKNPIKVDKDNLIVGKALYAKYCKSCHGHKGEGDGTRASEIDTPSTDFTTERFQSQTDGTIFYKIKEGRDDMPSYKKKISEDDDIWAIVNYVRTLKSETE